MRHEGWKLWDEGCGRVGLRRRKHAAASHTVPHIILDSQCMLKRGLGRGGSVLGGGGRRDVGGMWVGGWVCVCACGLAWGGESHSGAEQLNAVLHDCMLNA
jgi:hypothetical protein